MIKYGDKVTIVEGFYEGCKGIVVDYNIVAFKNIIYYNIEIRKAGASTTSSIKTIEVRENQLKIIK